MNELLEICDILFAYRREPVVRDVSLTLAAGEVVALVGPNGAGKSTLLKLALGQLKPWQGRVLWEGKPVAEWPRRELARRVAYLPQSPALIEGETVAQVLAAGRSPYLPAFGVERETDRQVVERVAAQLQLGELLSRPIDTLSGGQRQRVYLGRCLAQEPTAVLLDEPDAHLDLRRAAELGTLVRRLAHESGLGVLIASHDLNLAAAIADRVLLLSEGQAVACGRPSDVLSEANLTAAYGLPVRRLEGPPPVILPLIEGPS